MVLKKEKKVKRLKNKQVDKQNLEANGETRVPEEIKGNPQQGEMEQRQIHLQIVSIFRTWDKRVPRGMFLEEKD